MTELSAADQSIVDQVHAETRDDFDRLLAAARSFHINGGKVNGAVALTSAILAQPEWDRMMVASVLGIALMEIVESSRG